MAAHQNELQVRMMMGLGGTLDSFAGTVKRAPRWMIACSLEWLYRLLREPRRINRAVKLPLLVFAAACSRIKGERKTWQRES